MKIKSLALGLSALMVLTAGSAFAAYTPPTGALFSVNQSSLGAESSKIATWGDMTANGTEANRPVVVTTTGIDNLTDKWAHVTSNGAFYSGIQESKDASNVGKSGIDFSGFTIVTAVKRTENSTATSNIRSIVNIFQTGLVLGVMNNGQVKVRTELSSNATASTDTSGKANTTIGNDPIVLSLILKRITDTPNWTLSVYGNEYSNSSRTELLTPVTLTGATGFPTGVLKWTGTTEAKKRIGLGGIGYPAGSTLPGTSAFVGEIGDTYVYSSCLDDVARQDLVKYVAQDMGILAASPVPEPGTILAALSILAPAGMMFRRRKLA